MQGRRNVDRTAPQQHNVNYHLTRLQEPGDIEMSKQPTWRETPRTFKARKGMTLSAVIRDKELGNAAVLALAERVESCVG
jgi:cell envelope opacity-associated protein A